MTDDDMTRLPEDSNDEHTLAVGQLFGQFKIIRLLGRGGMGEVYEVEHVELATRHALKLIKQEISDRENVRQRFRREAQVMARLRDGNIVQVDDFGEAGGRVWLRMELIQGGALSEEWKVGSGEFASIADLLTGKPLPEELLVDLLKQILEGLSYAHEQGVVHRDLKPSNILLQSNSLQPNRPQAKICDFGLVSVIGADWLQSQIDLTHVDQPLDDSEATRLMNASGRSSSSRALIGTYHYMSPEQKRGDVVGPESDLYALGLIAFQMLTGEQNLGLELPSQLRPSLSKKWDGWISQAIRSKAELRYQTAQEMLDEMPTLQKRKSSFLPVVAISSILCVAGVLGYSFLTQSESSNPPQIQEPEMQTASPSPAEAIEMLVEESTDEGLEQIVPESTTAGLSEIEPAERDYLAEADLLLSIEEGAVEIEPVVSLLEQAADNGIAEAANRLGDLYYEAEFLKQDFDLALKWYQLAAEQDFPPAIDNLGVLYSNGQGVEKDQERAFELFSQAAEAGDLKGRHNLAIAYLDGSGTERDPKRAVELLEETAEEGMARSAFVLSAVYENGVDGYVESDPGKAFDYALAASESDISGFLSHLGYLYSSGIGVEKDMAKAIELWQQAVKEDDPLAQNNLGSLYLDGIGVEQDVERGIELLRAAADQGLGLAQYNLGVRYENGDGLDQDYFKAAYYYERAAKLGHADALNNLAGLYEFGNGVDKDVARALKIYQEASEKGSAAATYNLGRFYLYGIGVEKSSKEAVELLHESADRGVVAAFAMLGSAYELGDGVEQDYKQAFKWYKNAADAGSVFAQMNLGFLYLNGNGVKQDLVRAAELIEPAAKQGEPIAASQLGEMYERGLGVPVDLGKAKQYYTISAEAGGSFAMTELGIMYQNGRGVPIDVSKALEYFQEATDLGDMRAAVLAAFLYSKMGSDVFDINKAVEFYKLASNAGEHDATFQLGFLYQEGDVVKEDYAESMRLFRMGAEAGDAACQWGVGHLYNLGKGVKGNMDEAVFWYRRSAEQGDQGGQSSLATMYYFGVGVKKDYAEAAKWFRLAAEQGHMHAPFYLGEQYRMGRGVEKDLDEALRWYKRAADAGHIAASIKYEELIKSKPKRRPLSKTETEPKPEKAVISQAGSVLFVHVRTSGHQKLGKPEHYEHVVKEISELINEHAIALANDRVDVPLLFRGTLPPDEILAKARKTGASHLLLMSVGRPITRFVEINIECHDLQNGQLWSIDSDNSSGFKMGMSAVRQITEGVVENLESKLSDSTLPRKSKS